MADPRFSAVVAEPYDEAALRPLHDVAHVTLLDSCDEQNLTVAVADADALLVRTGANVTAQVIEAGARLRVIGRGGAGLDNIDVDAARREGVTVVYTPEASTNAVADLAVGLMIGLLRRLREMDAAVRESRFAEGRRVLGSELRELTLGIIGLGRIGKAVAHRCYHGFGMSVIHNDIVSMPALPFPATAVDKPALFAGCDVVSLHVPLTPDTRRLIDRDTLGRFRSHAILINTARGAVVDSEALAEALSTGRLGGAGLDVFEPEPLPTGHPLLSAPKTLFTPHIGARTPGSLGRMQAVVEDVVRVLTGQPPRYPA